MGALVAVMRSLGDETQLFVLLPELNKTQRSLLTYFHHSQAELS
jgi:hypothetical protein